MEKEPTAQNCSTMVITKAQISTSTVILRDDIEGNPLGFTIHVGFIKKFTIFTFKINSYFSS